MVNFLSDDVRRNPFDVYDQVRSFSPVVRDPKSDVWSVFDYDNVKRVLTDQATFSSEVSPGGASSKWFIFFDAARHTRSRALLMKAFTQKSVANLEPRIRELSRELLDKVLERGEMDMAHDFAIPLPMMVIGEMLGIPRKDWQRFRRWADTILLLSYLVPGSGTDAAVSIAQQFEAAGREMKEYVDSLIENRRRTPTDDLMTRLVEAELDGERLSAEDILGFFQLLLLAGTETTTNLLNNAILCFSEHPDQFNLLRAQPGLLTSAIEEVLRYRSPIQWMLRKTRQPLELHGQMIPAGRLVLPVIGSANRDPAHFPEPRRFDISRDPNPHIAFGHGIHFCLGAPLSRLEARIALGDILERMEQIEVLIGGSWEPRRGLHVHGPVSLPIRFQSATRRPAASRGITSSSPSNPIL